MKVEYLEDVLKNYKNNNYSQYSKNMTTFHKKCLQSLIDNSKTSIEDRDFDLRNIANNEDLYTKLKNVIHQWELIAKNEDGIYNIMYIPDNTGVCELCGHSGCGELHYIFNKTTRKYLKCGSVCILKLNPISTIDGEEVTAEEAIKYLKNVIDKDMERLHKIPGGKLFSYCIENTRRVIDHMSDKDKKIVSPIFEKNIMPYSEAVTSIMKCIDEGKEVTNDMLMAKNTNFKELVDNLSRWNRLNNTHLFVPNTTMIYTNSDIVNAKYSLCLSSLVSTYYINGNKPGNRSDYYNIAKDVWEHVNFVKIPSYKKQPPRSNRNYARFDQKIYSDIINDMTFKNKEARNEYESLPKAKRNITNKYHRAKCFNVIAVMLMLPNDEIEIKGYMTNVLKGPAENVKSAYWFKEDLHFYIEQLYKSTARKNDKSEFGKFIDLLYKCSNEVIVPTFANRTERTVINRSAHRRRSGYDG